MSCSASINPLLGLCRNFAEYTTCHGVGCLARAKSVFGRLLWILILSTAAVMLARQIQQLYFRYESNPVTTNIAVQTGPLPFPSITLCNLNIIRNSVVMQENINDENFKKLRELLMEIQSGNVDEISYIVPSDYNDLAPGNSTAPSGSGNEHDEGKLRDHIKQQQRQDLDKQYLYRQQMASYISRLTPETTFRLGHQKETFIHKCSFMGVACKMEQFSFYHSADYGNCFTFNSNEVRNSTMLVGRSGHDAGLDLILNIESNDYIPMYTTGYGVRLVVHEFGTFPFPSQDGLSIPAGFDTSISIKMRNITRLGPPFGICETPENFYESFNKKYTYEACAVVCTFKDLADECGCYQMALKHYYEDDKFIRPCNETQDITCLNDVRQTLKAGMSCDCKPPCQETSFDTSQSMNQWPTRSYRDYLIAKTCKENKTEICDQFKSEQNLGDTLVSLSIYYRELNIEVITQAPAYPFPNFLSDLGGTMGLWAGISILTCADFCYLVVNLVKTFIHIMYQKRKVDIVFTNNNQQIQETVIDGKESPSKLHDQSV